jgi:hypothetical protein
MSAVVLPSLSTKHVLGSRDMHVKSLLLQGYTDLRRSIAEVCDLLKKHSLLYSSMTLIMTRHISVIPLSSDFCALEFGAQTGAREQHPQPYMIDRSKG